MHPLFVRGSDPGRRPLTFWRPFWTVVAAVIAESRICIKKIKQADVYQLSQNLITRSPPKKDVRRVLHFAIFVVGECMKYHKNLSLL